MRIGLLLALLLQALTAAAADRITVITDAFGRNPRMKQDWGYAALVEIGGRRILFDTGNNARMFEQNVRSLGIDLRRLDFVVISHRHGDHTAGLRFLRKMNPKVTIYVPPDEHFGGPTPAAFLKPEPSLPAEQRYFNGAPPANVPHGSAWGDIVFTTVPATRELAPGVRLIRAVSEKPGMRDLNELSLVVDTESGPVVVVGCSHPGIDTILQEVSRGADPIRFLGGGLHWVGLGAADVQALAGELRGRFKVQSVAPGHCTSEAGFAELRKTFGENYVYAGVGTVIALD
jgi:7,8-dihydropterin-6-yl-methyl-4-(beta-D-ribofuranosyl)aminobenzene 5'-phosphate synthase